MNPTIADAVVVACRCKGCGLAIYSVPDKADVAFCQACHRERAGCDWTIGSPFGEWHPTVDYMIRQDAPPPASPDTFPAPLVTSAEPLAATAVIPGPVTDLARDLERAGWRTEITYARGYVPHATHGRPSEKPKHSWAVRAWRGTQRAVAVREDAAWASFWDFSDVQFFRRSAGLEAFTACVVGEMMNLPSRAEWDAMLVKYPLRPTRKQWDEMREAIQ